MCTVCKAFRPYREDCDYRDLSFPALVSESSDAADGTATIYDLAMGATFSGKINRDSDRDWVRVELVEGAEYQIDLTGRPSGAGTLEDPVLGLYDHSGAFVSGDDDGGDDTESRMVFTAGESGVFYLVAESFGGAAGSYEMKIRQTAGPAGPNGTSAADLEAMAEYLTDGYWQDRDGAPHRFDTSSDNRITVNIDALTREGKQAARWAMESWEAVADIDFVETRGDAQISFDDDRKGAFASYSQTGSITKHVDVNISARWLDDYGSRIGSYGFQTYIHEIGHALGLGHLGDYNFDADFASDHGFDADSWQLSVMSYFSQSQNPNIEATRAEPVTAMAVDVKAVQALYGAPDENSLTAGNTVYGKGHTLGESWLGLLFDTPDFFEESGNFSGSPFAMTLYDLSGFDLVDFSDDLFDQRIDLRPLAKSDAWGWTEHLVISEGTVIEAYAGGSGNDRIEGNEADNVLSGNAGSDTILGGAGDDRLDGGEGADRLDGGAGVDFADYRSMNRSVTVDLENSGLNGGGALRDVLSNIEGVYGSRASDGLFGDAGDNFLFGQQGGDRLDGRGGDDRLDGGGGRDAIKGGSGADVLKGGAGSDRMAGGTEDDRLIGGGGRDRLMGEDGDDIMSGGKGRDTFVFSTGADTIRDFRGDRLLIDSDLLFNGETLADVMERAEVSGRQTVFDFGSGDILTLRGGFDLAELEASMAII
jgi:serralysin